MNYKLLLCVSDGSGTLFGKGIFTASSLEYSVAFMIIVLIVGIAMFNKVEKTFMDTV